MAYRELQRAAYMEQHEDIQSRRTGGAFADYFSIKAGPTGKPLRYTIRLLPPHEKMESVFVEAKMHFLPSKEIGKMGRPIPIGINCLAAFGKDCGACKRVDDLRKDAKNEDTPDVKAALDRQASDQAAKIRTFVNMIHVEEANKGVQRWAFGPDVAKKLDKCFFDDDGEWRDITHPRIGRDVIVDVEKRVGTDWNDYAIRPKEKTTALVDMDWLDKIEDLTELTKEPTIAEITTALSGVNPWKKDGGVAPSQPKKETGAPASTRTRKDTPPVAEEAPATLAKKKRQPVGEVAEEEGVEENEFAAAEAAAKKAGFTAIKITRDELAVIKKPTCYGDETDPADGMCQGCRVFKPCYMDNPKTPKRVAA